MKRHKITIVLLSYAAFAAALLLFAAPTLPQSSTVVGVTVQNAPACQADDLTVESRALIQRWWELNQNLDAETITAEEFEEGRKLLVTGQCGLLRGGIPVVVKLLDGLDYLGVFPDGATLIFKASGFIRDTE